MKIGAMAESFRKPLKEVVRLAADMGISGLQMYITRGEYDVDKFTDEKIAEVQTLLKDNSLEISAFCGDLGGHGFMNEKDNEWRVAKSKRMVDLAKKMQVKVITTHVGLIPEDKNEKQYKIMYAAVKEIGAYAKENGVTFAVETGPETAPVLYDFIKELDGVGVNLDPANFVMVTGQDPVEAVKLLGKYIVHTHAKDGIMVKKGDPRRTYGCPIPAGEKTVKPVFKEVPLGKGQVNYPEYVKALREVGYDGYLTIERECGASPLKDISLAANFLKTLIFGKERVVVGLVGCGGIANGAHIPSFKALPNVRVKYCCDLVIERAEKAAGRCGENGYTKCVTDYHDILVDDEVDAVVVATHTHMHAKIAIDAMRAGKHSLSEKPVAMNYAEAEEMARVAKETGKICNVGVCMRFDGAVNAIKNLNDNGVLGNIYSVYCSFRGIRNIPGIGGEFTNSAHSGGGVLFDWGVHFIDLIMYILGSPKIVSASGKTYLEIGKDMANYSHSKGGWHAAAVGGEKVCDVEDYVTGFVRTENNASITLNGAWAQNIGVREMYVDFLGDKAGVRLHYGGHFELFNTGVESKKLRGVFALLRLARDISRVKPKFNHRNIYRTEMAAFLTDVMVGTHSRAYIDNLLPTAKMLDMLYESAKEDKEIQAD